LEYLTAKEKAFPPENDDVPSLIGLKKTCGYCHGMLGKYAISDRLLEEAEHLARNAGFLELLCEVWYCQGRWPAHQPRRIAISLEKLCPVHRGLIAMSGS
jgi:hypothetical protein